MINSLQQLNMLLEDSQEFGSSAISWAKYNKKTGELIIVFNPSAKRYSYPDVSEEVWEEFKESTSAGRYFWQHIR